MAGALGEPLLCVQAVHVLLGPMPSVQQARPLCGVVQRPY
jgi:hypothetical protein